MRRCVQVFGEAIPRQRGGAVIRSRLRFWDRLLVMVTAAAVVVVMVAMVMAVVVVVCAGLAVGIVMMVWIVMIVTMSSRRGRKQSGRGGGGQDLDAPGSRCADFVDVFEQLVQRRHVHHSLREGLLGLVVM